MSAWTSHNLLLHLPPLSAPGAVPEMWRYAPPIRMYFYLKPWTEQHAGAVGDVATGMRRQIISSRGIDLHTGSGCGRNLGTK